MKDFIDILNTKIQQGEAVILVTVVEVTGSAPQRLGAKMLVSKAGNLLWGTIGGGTIENLALKQSKIQFEKKESLLKEYILTENGEKATGMLCGGKMCLFFDIIGSQPKIYIFGAGHITQELVPILKNLGFRICVIDDRKDYLKEKFPYDGLLETVSGEIPQIIDSLELIEGSYVVIITYSHRIDVEILKYLLTNKSDKISKIKYLGMIGSKRKVNEIFKRLISDGVDEFLLNNVHAPIGLQINSHTPEEIAISIAAEIIKVKNSKEE